MDKIFWLKFEIVFLIDNHHKIIYIPVRSECLSYGVFYINSIKMMTFGTDTKRKVEFEASKSLILIFDRLTLLFDFDLVI